MWWLLRLNHDLGSAGRVFVGSCFDSCGSKLVQDIVAVSVAQQVGPVAMRMMNKISRDLFVISSFYGVLFVKGGCTVLQFNISSLSQKKNDCI